MAASVTYTEHIHEGPSDIDADTPFNFKLPATNKISDNPDAFLSEPGTLIQVKVDTTIKDLSSVKAKEAGSFIYSFFVPKNALGDNNPGYCLVIPQTYSEMMEYVSGRRRAQDTALFVDTLPRVH